VSHPLHVSVLNLVFDDELLERFPHFLRGSFGGLIFLTKIRDLSFEILAETVFQFDEICSFEQLLVHLFEPAGELFVLFSEPF